MLFVRRIGPDPHRADDGTSVDTPSASGCPDIWELADGDIAIIGRRIDESAKLVLPSGVSCGADEEIVVFPRKQMIRARDDIARLV